MVSVSGNAVDALRSGFGGEVVLPGDTGYDDAALALERRHRSPARRDHVRVVGRRRRRRDPLRA